VTFVEETNSDLLRNIDLVYFETAVLVPFSKYILEIFEQIDNQDLPSSCAAKQYISGHGVELHGSDLVLRKDGK